MADKQVTLNFHLSDGTTESVSFTVPEGGGGTGGGINVIEYDPSLHKVVNYTVVGTDFQSVLGSTTQTNDTTNWNAATGVMTIANATEAPASYPNNNAEYIGLRLNPSLYGLRGTFTIDASLCEDGWGFALLGRETYFGFDRIDLYAYLEQQHYTTVYGGAQDLQQPQTFGMFLTEDDTYEGRVWNNDLFDNSYAARTRATYGVKPKGVYTFTIGSGVEYIMESFGVTREHALAQIATLGPEVAAALIAKTLVFNTDELVALELKADTPYLHLFMSAYHKESQTGTHQLNPTSQLTITYDLEDTINVPPVAAVDGDFLHMTGDATLFGKFVGTGSFVQLYDNKTKMIVHSNLDNVDSVGSVALGETSSTAYRGDRGKISYDHSLSQGNPHNTTSSDITEGTNLFFTEDRVNQTVLTGLDISTATPALATDQLLAAIGKLQAQINNIAPPVWVDASSIGTTHGAFTGLQFAKINGLLWVRGSFSNIAYISAGTNLFLLTDPTYRLDIPLAFILAINLGEVLAFDASPPTKRTLQMRNVSNSANYFSLNNELFMSSGSFGVIQPTAIGRLLTP